VFRWRDACTQWLGFRVRDIAWLHARSAFLQKVPGILTEYEWVFVVGCNNSGTTLIHDVLAATGQFSFMPHEGQRYTRVLRPAHKRGFERVWTEYLSELRLDESDSIARVPRLIFDWLAAMDTPAKARILEKTTANAVRMRWLQRALPRSAFIGVVRSAYAVAEGIRRKGSKEVGRGARHWRKANQIMLDDSRHVSRFMLVRYEDFVASPAEMLLRMARFLELSEPQIDQALVRFGYDTARGAIQDMNAESLRRLTSEEVVAINMEAGDLMESLGYLPAEVPQSRKATSAEERQGM
jgi:Sulfotransferase family